MPYEDFLIKGHSQKSCSLSGLMTLVCTAVFPNADLELSGKTNNTERSWTKEALGKQDAGSEKQANWSSVQTTLER